MLEKASKMLTKNSENTFTVLISLLSDKFPKEMIGPLHVSRLTNNNHSLHLKKMTDMLKKTFKAFMKTARKTSEWHFFCENVNGYKKHIVENNQNETFGESRRSHQSYSTKI